MDKAITLYLIPVDLGHSPEGGIYAPEQLRIIHSLKYFITENASTARKMLKKCGYPHPLQEIEMIEFNEHTRVFPETMADVKTMLDQPENVGMMSEAGMPCVADPGHEVVRLAHSLQLHVVPMHGPSSIMQALVASGLQGQQFVFHGYLPAKTEARKAKLRAISQQMIKDHFTHIFMEAPYRSNQLVADVLQSAGENAMLCIASEIGTPEEFIGTKKTGQWKKSLPDLHKKRCIFCLSA